MPAPCTCSAERSRPENPPSPGNLRRSPAACWSAKMPGSPQLYPDALVSIQDYVLLSARLRGAMQPHIVSLLQAGTSVVLDFPSNTPSTRAWARSIFEAAGAPHALHWLQLPDEECKRRLRARNASGEHPFETSDAQFDLISQHFVAPSAAEGFELVLHA